MSRDGVPVCSHDATLLRLFARDVAVSQLTAEALSHLTSDRSAIVPLDSVLDMVLGRCSVIVELKTDPRLSGTRADLRVAEAVAELLERRRRVGKADQIFAVSSFSHGLVAHFMHVSPTHPTAGALVSSHWRVASATMLEARRRGISQVHLHYSAALKEPWIGAFARASMISVAAYTVNVPRLTHLLRRLGIDWIISDDPYQLDPRR
jgi:glycerophosphoryl diester phosphodiesterase